MVKIRIREIVYEVVDDFLGEEAIRDMVLKAVDFINSLDESSFPISRDNALVEIIENLYRFELQEYEDNSDIIDF